jgi:hypothetical protein
VKCVSRTFIKLENVLVCQIIVALIVGVIIGVILLLIEPPTKNILVTFDFSNGKQTTLLVDVLNSFEKIESQLRSKMDISPDYSIEFLIGGKSLYYLLHKLIFRLQIGFYKDFGLL